MSVRSRRLVDPLALSAAGAVVYTAPAGRIVLVKGVRLVNVTGMLQSVRLTIGAEAEANAVYWDLPLLPGQHFTDDSWWVLEAGDQLRAAASDDEAVTMMVSGSELGGA